MGEGARRADEGDLNEVFMSIKITKMQGCGNDFVILDYEEFLKMDCKMDEAAHKLCDRNFGIGADGLIIPNTNTEDADIGWFFYNSDGTTAQMCGNGMRCFAKYVYDKKLKDISEEFNISQSRISRIIQNALEKIKKELLKQERLDEDNI